MIDYSDDNILLKVDNLCQFFKMGRRQLKAVNNVSFNIYKSEVFGLVGESGCGKTTTGRSIIKLYDCTSGSVYFKGRRICAGIGSYKDAIEAKKKQLTEDIKKLSAEESNPDILNARLEEIRQEAAEFISTQRELIKSAKHDHKYCDKEYAAEHVAEIKKQYEQMIASETDPQKKSKLHKEYREKLAIAKNERLVTQIQMIFQDPIASLNPRMTVREIIAEGLIIKGIKDKKYIDEKVYQALDMVGLVAEHSTRYPHEFSGGQRQRIGVARSVIMRPDMIIADEPISALDVSIQAQVINLLNDLRQELGLTIMFIAHDLSVVKYFSDRIGVMYYGNLVELTTSDKLFAHPLHPYTKSLLSAIPLPDPLYEKKRKRITYNPVRDHDYRSEQPQLREVEEGHFVLCDTKEFEQYQRIVKEG